MLLKSTSPYRALLACLLAPVAATLAGAADFTKDIKPLIDTHCVECHSDKKAKGGVDLAMFANEAAVRRDVPTWRKVAEQLTSKEMPTEKAKHPMPDDARATLVTYVNETLKAAVAEAAKIKDPGAAPVRRLTRTQYRNTVRDLLGVEAVQRSPVVLPFRQDR